MHFERNILAYVSREKVKEVAEDLREIFQVKRRNIAEVLIQEFIKKYRKHFPRAVEIFKQGIFEALTYLNFPASHQRHIKSTNMLERLFREIKRRKGGQEWLEFPNERSLTNLATAVMLRTTED